MRRPSCGVLDRQITCWSASKQIPPESDMAHRLEKERNAARSRAAILDAAEKLFAEKGYDATSLSEVGAAAGVSRGTPGYFFGSKQELYDAVLERCFEEVRQAVRAGRARAMASQQPQIGRASC